MPLVNATSGSAVIEHQTTKGNAPNTSNPFEKKTFASVEEQMEQIQTWHDNLAQRETELNAAEAARNQKVDTALGELTHTTVLAPNQIRDSKRWRSFCGGQVNTPVQVGDSDAVSFPWSVGGSAKGSTSFEVIPITNTARLTELGLDDLSIFETCNMIGRKYSSVVHYGSDWRVLVWDINASDNQPSGAYQILQTDCNTYVGWGKGNHTSYMSVFAAVLNIPDGSSISLDNNRSSGSLRDLDKNDVGKGWQLFTGKRRGFDGCGQWFGIRPKAAGRHRIAIALPYFGTGDHGDKAVWAGYVGTETAYTHEDVVVS